MRTTIALLLLLCASISSIADTPTPTPLVDLKAYDFSIKLDMRYATADNFTHKVVYPAAECYVRKPVAEALARVQAALKLEGLSLKMWDCYRPLAVQKRFWDLVPDERYVADPKKGSRHNRGAAVDVTLVDRQGEELQMPTAFDDFTRKAHRDYKGGSRLSRRNRERLQKAMVREGFIPFPTEWWHFDFKDWEKYPLEDVSFEQLKKS